MHKCPAIEDIKYAKTGATEAEIKAKFEEAFLQIEKYKKDERFAGRSDLKFAALVFRGKGDCEARESSIS